MNKSKGFASIVVIGIVGLVVGLAFGSYFGLPYLREYKEKARLEEYQASNKAYYQRDYDSLKLIDFDLYLPTYIPEGLSWYGMSNEFDLDNSHEVPHKPNFLTFKFGAKGKYGFTLTQSNLFDYNPPTSCGSYSPPKSISAPLSNCLPNETNCYYCELEATTKVGYQIYHHFMPRLSNDTYLVRIDNTLIAYDAYKSGRSLSFEEFSKVIDSMEKISKDVILEKEKSNYAQYIDQ